MVDHSIRFLGDAEDEITHSDPEQVVRDAIDLAFDMARGAANEFHKIVYDSSGAKRSQGEIRRRYHQSWGRAFPIFLGYHDSDYTKTVDRVERGLNGIVDKIDKGLTVKCRPSSGRRCRHCKEGYNAYVSGARGRFNRTFTLCPPWFAFSSETRRAVVVAHELIHCTFGHRLGDDQHDAHDKKVSDADSAIQFAWDDPERACHNAENFEQFLQYRHSLSGADKIANSKWTGVPEDVDAVVTAHGKHYFFKAGKYHRYDPAKGKVDKVGITGTSGWSGVPSDIDAGILHPKNGNYYFFKGQKYHRYVPGEGVDKVGTVGTDGWWDMRGNIDAATLDPVSGDGLFFRGAELVRYDFETDRAAAPVPLRSGAFGALFGHFDAVVHDAPANRLTFFTDRHLHEATI